MVQLNMDNNTKCVVYVPEYGTRLQIVVYPNHTVEKVFENINSQLVPYDSVDLVLQPSNEDNNMILLNSLKSSKMYNISGFVEGTDNILILLPEGTYKNDPNKRYALPILERKPVTMSSDNSPTNSIKYQKPIEYSQTTVDSSTSPIRFEHLSIDDDLVLGASASPTEQDPLNCSISSISSNEQKNDCACASKSEQCPDSPIIDSYDKTKYNYRNISSGYVGLVNQAMTCYLNSLLQALFMTPEFRNALYNWEFDNDNESRSIPYQLQKLFLNLQTTKKTSIETTDLTRSFYWDSTDAWQQHDVQELCRVMFDALEHKFKDTKQANLISNLYEGKMIDYVKCLECNTEKQRLDTFLDIPLPIRPFGSTEPYSCIEESLQAFVQPEILDDTNQYFCEKCDKKCNAHKGLKFQTFPYILTLHLKRFDIDYQTLHRIKLNDRVTFPQKLNLNDFVSANNANAPNGDNGATDDCSTADSGSPMEDENCVNGTTSSVSCNQTESEVQDDDEGIDVSSGTDNHHRTSTLSTTNGPYIYELFAILIHSGSASGGHYYAYIKEFENNKWYCFNDQNVSAITEDDIERSFGSGSNKLYYSTMYTSSTNAYMLMYRQIDPKRNEHVLTSDKFPEHINKLLQKLNIEEEMKRNRPTVDNSDLKARIYFHNPKLDQMKHRRINVAPTCELSNILDIAYTILNVSEFAPMSLCRLVLYDSTNEEIIHSFSAIENLTIGDVLNDKYYSPTFLLEYREQHQDFTDYSPNSASFKVFKINLKTLDLNDGVCVRSCGLDDDVLKKDIAKKLEMDINSFYFYNLSLGSVSKVFVGSIENENSTIKSEQAFEELVHTLFINVITLYVIVPSIHCVTMASLQIPQYDITNKLSKNGEDVVDAVLINGSKVASMNHLNLNNELQFNVDSEDSSCSDGDRTLVEEKSQVSSAAHSPQISSPEDEQYNINGDSINSKVTPKLSCNLQTNFVDDDDSESMYTYDYFRSRLLVEFNVNTKAATNTVVDKRSINASGKVFDETMYKIVVDRRMTIGAFKQYLEPLVKVPVDYFKITRKHMDSPKKEYTNLNERLKLFREGDELKIELGKNLKNGEHRAKVCFVWLSKITNESGKLSSIGDWVFKIGTSVIDAKKSLIDILHKLDNSQYGGLTLDNFRLWEKAGRNLIKIFSNDEKIGNDLCVDSVPIEFLVQQCDNGVCTEIPHDSVIYFVRRWHPSKLELDDFQEVILDKNTSIEKKLAEISNLNEENIIYSQINYGFPCTEMQLLNINNPKNWCSYTMPKKSPSGSVFFYKDKYEQFKELTDEERREVSAKEKLRIDRINGLLPSSSTYQSRPERALKIYLDSPSK